MCYGCVIYYTVRSFNYVWAVRAQSTPYLIRMCLVCFFQFMTLQDKITINLSKKDNKNHSISSGNADSKSFRIRSCRFFLTYPNIDSSLSNIKEDALSSFTENAIDLRRAYGSTRVPPHTVKILACNNPDVYLNRPEQVTRRLLNCEIVNKLY